MIYQQPVRHEYHLIAPPTLLIVGAEDHVVPRATRVVIPECGHIPHLEVPGQFLAEFLPFLARQPD
jgi:pimeloyl-ACP methyl ester carboxylesterase